MTEQDFAPRLALGTAQFGLDYGINNRNGKPSLSAVADILEEAQRVGINLLDTAAGYGDAESRLGSLGNKLEKFDIVTKLAPGSAESVVGQIADSQARLGRERVYGILFHSAQKFSSTDSGWQVLCTAVQNHTAQKAGLSIYRMAHLLQGDFTNVVGLPNAPHLLQVPFSVLDQHFGAHLSYLAETGKIEIHARSVFLQGLLLRNPQGLPSFFNPLAPKIQLLRRIAADASIPLPALLLLFVAQTPGISRVVIGVESIDNLHENLRAASYWKTALEIRPQLLALAEPDDTYTLPYTWPKSTQ